MILEKQGLNPQKRIDELEKRIEALEQLLNERKQTKLISFFNFVFFHF